MQNNITFVSIVAISKLLSQSGKKSVLPIVIGSEAFFYLIYFKILVNYLAISFNRIIDHFRPDQVVWDLENGFGELF